MTLVLWMTMLFYFSWMPLNFYRASKPTIVKDFKNKQDVIAVVNLQ